jgi:hypothetical protein
MFRDSVGPADDLCLGTVWAPPMILPPRVTKVPQLPLRIDYVNTLGRKPPRVTKVPQLPLRIDYVNTLGRKRGLSATQPACALAQGSITGLIQHECMRGLPIRGRLSRLHVFVYGQVPGPHTNELSDENARRCRHTKEMPSPIHDVMAWDGEGSGT